MIKIQEKMEKQIFIFLLKYIFLLKEASDNLFELVWQNLLDCEKVAEYHIYSFEGNPPLSDNETITLELLDVNDEVPQFP